MTPYIRYIGTIRSRSDWDENPESAYQKLDLDNRAIFLLGQACILNYLDKMHGIRSIPFMSDYKKYILILSRALYQDAQALQSAGGKDIMYTVDSIFTLLNISSEDGANIRTAVDIDHIVETLFGETKNDIPMPVVSGFLVPYLKYINALAGRRLTDDVIFNQSVNFEYTGAAYLPVFRMVRDTLSVEYTYGNNKVLQFSLTADALSNVAFARFPLFQWLSCFKWTGYNVTEMLFCLKQHCLNYDADDDATASARLLYALHCRLDQVTAPFIGKITLDYREQSDLKALIILLYNRDSLVVDNRKLLGEVFTGYDDKSKPIVDYFSADTPAEVSIESLNAFKSSIWGKIKELQLSFANAATEGDPDAKEKEDKPVEPANAPEPDSNEANSDQGDETANTPKEEAPADTDEDLMPEEADEFGGDESGQPVDGTSEEETNDTHTPLPPPSTDDKTGIRIAFAMLDDETPDSMMFRLEMEGFIDSILANPPKHLSKQKINLLKLVRGQLLYLLHISSLRDIVAIATKLPVAFKTFQNNLEINK